MPQPFTYIFIKIGILYLYPLLSFILRRIPIFRFKNRNTIIDYKSYAPGSEGYFSSVTGTMLTNLWALWDGERVLMLLSA